MVLVIDRCLGSLCTSRSRHWLIGEDLLPRVSHANRPAASVPQGGGPLRVDMARLTVGEPPSGSSLK
jgi:hypothetical protein